MEWWQDPSLSPLSLLLPSSSHNSPHSLGTSCAPDTILTASHALSSVSPNCVRYYYLVPFSAEEAVAQRGGGVALEKSHN